MKVIPSWDWFTVYGIEESWQLQIVKSNTNIIVEGLPDT